MQEVGPDERQSRNQGAGLLCCGVDMGQAQDGEASKDPKLDFNPYSVAQIGEYDHFKTNSNERIVFASFLEDINPNYLLVVTYDTEKGKSSISVIKIIKKEAAMAAKRKSSKPSEGSEKPQVYEDCNESLKTKISKQIYMEPEQYRIRKNQFDENYFLKLDSQKSESLLKMHKYAESTIPSQKANSVYVSRNEHEEIKDPTFETEEPATPDFWALGEPETKLSIKNGMAFNSYNSKKPYDQVAAVQKAKRSRFPYKMAIQQIKAFEGVHFQVVSFSNSNIYGKLMFTVDSL